MAAYIDLNPVRAGIVDDPKDYRYCAYTEAVAGQSNAVCGLKFITSGLYSVSGADAVQAYRFLLFGKGSAPVEGGASIDRAKAIQVLKYEQGKLPATTLLRCRIRYFTEGAVLGSREFVAAHLDSWKHLSGRKYFPKPHAIPTETGEALVVIKNVRGQAYS